MGSCLVFKHFELYQGGRLMTRLTVFLLALLGMYSVQAGGLVPERSPYDQFLSEYRIALLRTFQPAILGAPRLQMLALPSFEKEYAITVLADRERALLRVVTLDAQVWASYSDGTYQEGTHPTASATDIDISYSFYKDLERYTCNAISEASFDNATMGLDGEAYYFSAICMELGFDGGARAWSPDPDSDAGELVAVYDSLLHVAALPESKRAAQIDEIHKRIRELNRPWWKFWSPD